MAPSSSSFFSSSSCNWVYDVFPSFSGEDVRVTFLSHFLKELDRKLIIAFKDNEIERSRSLDPELKQAIQDSRVALVIFSENYASSSWCLSELLEIVKCKEECGQMVIPVFYGLDPSHVRKQTGDFGKIFEETCKNKTEEVKIRWRGALTDVANILGYHSATWGNEATMIEAISNDVLGKLLLTPSTDYENFVGIEDHIAQMSALLHLESKEVRMVGIWGSSGIGKTTLARILFNRLSRHFQGCIYIDRRFISNSMEVYSKSNPDDYNMKLHMQENFLSKILGRQVIEVDHLGAVREKLRRMKVLIFIDDLDDQVVLDTLVGGDEWFGPKSRIIVITKDKQILRGHGITCIYEVGIPSEKVALQMFCRSAFKKNYPPDGFMELASEVVIRAGGLPLGLNLLGSSLRGRNKKYWVDMMPTLRDGLDGKIEKALRVSYDGLERKEHKALFRHIACFFNGYEVNDIKLILADSELNVDLGLQILVDKSLIQVSIDTNIVEMHCLVQEMGKEIVRAQSDGEREFLFDSKNVCDVLEDGTGTKKVLGISLDMDEIDELQIHKEAFKDMQNLRFLNIYTNKWDQEKEVRWHLPEGFNYLPPKLRLLRLDGYPMRSLPSNFRAGNLVKLQMKGSKLEKLWDGVQSLTGLTNLDLFGSENLKEIPDLTMATNLKKLVLSFCSSLVELPSSIQYLNKLEQLHMLYCENLESLPTEINLQSLHQLNLRGCSRLKRFPNISSNVSEISLEKTAIEEFPSELRLENLVGLDMDGMKRGKSWQRVQPLKPLMAMLSPSLMRLELSDISSLVELPSYIQYFYKLESLGITRCTNLETLPEGINLQSLDRLKLSGCSRLKTFPDISTNISQLILDNTAIEEVPWWIEDFSRLTSLYMMECNNLRRVSLNILKLKYLYAAHFPNCGELSEAIWDDCPSVVAMPTDNIDPWLQLDFTKCFNLDQEHLIQQQRIFEYLFLPGEEVPSYFCHRTAGTSLAISRLQKPPFQQTSRCRVCLVVDSGSFLTGYHSFTIFLFCRIIDRLGNPFSSVTMSRKLRTPLVGKHLIIFDTFCTFNYSSPSNEGNDPLDELNYCLNIEFQMASSNSTIKLKGCGIRLSVDCETDQGELCEDSADSDIGSETDQGELCEDSADSDIGSETDQGEECGDSADSYMGSETDQGEECGDSANSDIGSETDQFEVCEDNDDSDIGSETDQFEECEDSDDSDIGRETDQFEECEDGDDSDI